MRITSGVLGGRTIKVPIKFVRPTQERVREALFSSLSDRVVDARVLDVFAGSGALGIEAWSRGAKAVTLVEKQGIVFNNLRENIENLKKNGPDGTIQCVKMDALLFLKKSAPAPYDLIFADPPYEDLVFEQVLESIDKMKHLSDGGLIVYEMRSKKWLMEAPLKFLIESDKWELVRQKTYGEAALLMIQRKVGKE